MDILQINVLVLAYLGDSVYENYIREYLINKNIAKVNDLQELAINYVSAKNQAKIYQGLINKNILTSEELEIGTRARNHSSSHRPKSCDIITYKYATALEAIIGYLKLAKKQDRVMEIMDYIVKEYPVC